MCALPKKAPPAGEFFSAGGLFASRRRYLGMALSAV